MSQTWNGWPQNCPPSTSADADGTYFHLLQTNPPSGNDLKTYFERRGTKDCTDRALSVFVSEEKILHFRNVCPTGAKLGSFVARLELAPQHGKIKVPVRSDGHTEWWPTPGLDRQTVIQEIKSCPPIKT